MRRAPNALTAHLALSDLAKRLDQVQLALALEPLQVVHSLLHHLLRSLPKLSVLLGQQREVLVEQVPLLVLVQDRDDRDEDS